MGGAGGVRALPGGPALLEGAGAFAGPSVPRGGFAQLRSAAPGYVSLAGGDLRPRSLRQREGP